MLYISKEVSGVSKCTLIAIVIGTHTQARKGREPVLQGPFARCGCVLAILPIIIEVFCKAQ